MTAQKLLQLLELYSNAFILDLVDHIERNKEINFKLHELCCQKKVTLKVRPLNNVDHHIRTFLDEVLTCYNLFRGVGSQGIDSGQINNPDMVPLVLQITFVLFNGHP